MVLRTDDGDGHEGHGFAFTIGRGNDVQAAAIAALRPYLVGRPLDPLLADLGGFWRELVHDSQLRWLGPEKGVMHMAIAAVVNALWDLKAKRAGLPLWRLLSAMSPGGAGGAGRLPLPDRRLTPDEATAILRGARAGRAERERQVLEHGYPAYTTSPGWLGYDDDKLRRLCQAGRRRRVHPDQAQGRRRPGRRHPPPAHRPRGVRPGHPHRGRRQPALGRGQRDRLDTRAGPVRARAGSRSRPARTTCSGWRRIARAIAPVPVATGEHVQNRVVFKQLLQLEAISYLQLDAARVAGVNENLAILLLAAKFGVPVCPHAGGVGLCELVQHLSMFDYVAVSGSMDDRVIEYVDHLHEHFVDPVRGPRGPLPGPRRAGLRLHHAAGVAGRLRVP